MAAQEDLREADSESPDTVCTSGQHLEEDAGSPMPPLGDKATLGNLISEAGGAVARAQCAAVKHWCYHERDGFGAPSLNPFQDDNSVKIAEHEGKRYWLRAVNRNHKITLHCDPELMHGRALVIEHPFWRFVPKSFAFFDIEVEGWAGVPTPSVEALEHRDTADGEDAGEVGSKETGGKLEIRKTARQDRCPARVQLCCSERRPCCKGCLPFGSGRRVLNLTGSVTSK
ncbi:unnamed protein product [Amoebophrya sp. A120]|nr:unnamed protein product [Amoebophrya sp. A120]|eukprot:GSA120T00011508001.1